MLAYTLDLCPNSLNSMDPTYLDIAQVTRLLSRSENNQLTP